MARLCVPEWPLTRATTVIDGQICPLSVSCLGVVGVVPSYFGSAFDPASRMDLYLPGAGNGLDR
jgi:hypothetical protein